MGRIAHCQYLIQKMMLSAAWAAFLCVVGYMGGAMLNDKPEPVRGNSSVVLSVPPPAFTMAPVQPLNNDAPDTLSSPVPVNVMPSSNISQANMAVDGNKGHIIKMPDAAAGLPMPALPSVANDVNVLDLSASGPAATQNITPQNQLQAQQVADETGMPINAPSPFAAVVPLMPQHAQTLQVQPNGTTQVMPADARVQRMPR